MFNKKKPLYQGTTKFQKSLRQGQTVYRVSSLGASSFVEKLVLTGRPYILFDLFGDPSPFQPVKKFSVFYKGKSYKSEFSLEDSNVIPNRYNNHRLFTSKKKAESYLKLCKLGGVGAYDFRRGD